MSAERQQLGDQRVPYAQDWIQEFQVRSEPAKVARESRNPGKPVKKRSIQAASRMSQGRKSPDQAGLAAGGESNSTRYPRLCSSRIILRARTFLASTLTAGPRSS